MIVLDTSVLIAYFKADDRHHAAAVAVLAEHAGVEMVVSTVTLAEFFVGPARSGGLDRAVANLAALGIAESPLPDDAAARLAGLRAQPGFPRLPDCCVLLAGQVAAAAAGDVAIASFDDSLRSAAARCGWAVVPAPAEMASDARA